jgi:hypothetical protein
MTPKSGQRQDFKIKPVGIVGKRRSNFSIPNLKASPLKNGQMFPKHPLKNLKSLNKTIVENEQEESLVEDKKNPINQS